MAQNDFWGKFKKGIKRATSAAADFTEEQAIIGKLKFEILNLKRKIDRLHNELGVRISELSNITPRPDPFKDGEIKTALEKVVDLEKQIQEKRKSITQVADDFRTKAEQTRTAEDKEVETPGKPTPPGKAAAEVKPDEKPEPKPKRKYTRRKPVQKSEPKKSATTEGKKRTYRKRGTKKTEKPPETPESGGEK